MSATCSREINPINRVCALSFSIGGGENRPRMMRGGGRARAAARRSPPPDRAASSVPTRKKEAAINRGGGGKGEKKKEGKGRGPNDYNGITGAGKQRVRGQWRQKAKDPCPQISSARALKLFHPCPDLPFIFGHEQGQEVRLCCGMKSWTGERERERKEIHTA